jgi:hypothetical protein
MMGSTTILRGFKVSVAVLDAFLAANGVDETNGTPPLYKHHPDEDLISEITKAGGTANKNKFRVIIPSREGYNPTSHMLHTPGPRYTRTEGTENGDSVV